jgi:hypothetical protein
MRAHAARAPDAGDQRCRGEEHQERVDRGAVTQRLDDEDTTLRNLSTGIVYFEGIRPGNAARDL